MNRTAAGPGLPVQVKDVQPGTAGFELVLALAARVLAQDRYLTWHFPDALESQQCRIAGCYRMRSRSPVTSTENYALKIAAGYILHPSQENDSSYFLRRL